MSVTFRTGDSLEPAVRQLADAISSRLMRGQRVLWLVAGGSSMPVAVDVSKKLKVSGVPLDTLVISLTDERYGDVGHANSNWRQLKELGFDVPGAVLQPVLTGKDMAATVAEFGAFLDTELGKADYRIGLFGIGPDGHTAGVLPHSSAVAEPQVAHGYDAGNYKRVTMTPAAIVRLDEAIVYATGENKWPVLDRLETDTPVDEQPAQVLKRVPKTTIFNDHRGEKA